MFIRERMFRVAEHLPLTVVSPQPWFPLQGLIRRFRPHFRPLPSVDREVQQGIPVHYPRFFSVPGLFKSWDGDFMAWGCRRLLERIRSTSGFDVIDAHFAYPDGYAAVRLGRRFQVPVTITLRGTEVPLSRDPARREKILQALDGADRVFAVSESLKRHVVTLGADGDKITVVGNGVDVDRFRPVPRDEARRALGIPEKSRALITVGALVPRKGQQRVLEVLPRLLSRFPDLLYLMVGGASPEGDQTEALQRQVADLGLEEHVRFLGPVAPDELRVPLSAADVFVLATANEGWANVFLEAMACGLPVVTTDVGGNREVVCREELGIVVPYGDAGALRQALTTALEKEWDRDRIVAYARENGWERRVAVLVEAFQRLLEGR